MDKQEINELEIKKIITRAIGEAILIGVEFGFHAHEKGETLESAKFYASKGVDLANFLAKYSPPA